MGLFPRPGELIYQGTAMANSGSSTASQTGNGQANNQGQASLAYQLTSGKAYNPDAYYLDASDGRGHSEQINIKVPPRIEHVIDILVGESDQYRTRQDFMRDAMFHWAHHRATNTGGVDPLAEQLLEEEAAAARTQMRRRLREARLRNMQDTLELVEDLIQDKDIPRLNEELDRVAMLSEDPDIAPGMRTRYNELWHEINDAIFKDQAREFRNKRKSG
jgi:Arc/MetJ-type ribon-helix-helix transcriptional regulator